MIVIQLNKYTDMAWEGFAVSSPSSYLTVRRQLVPHGLLAPLVVLIASAAVDLGRDEWP